MDFTSLQVCMDSVDWLQDTIYEESGMDSSSPLGDMLTYSRPLIERSRLRLQHEQALKCPRCDSTHTKFCYYNNYSLSQPRYFCKTCRRYWTKGGTLRNIPIGGGYRKNQKVSNKKGSDQPTNNTRNFIHSTSSSSATMLSHDPTDLQLSFPEVQLSQLNSIITTQGTLANPTSYMDNKYDMSVLENSSKHIDFMDSKWEAIVGSSGNNNYDFMGDGHEHLEMVNGLGDHHLGHNGLSPNFRGFCTPCGVCLDRGNSISNTPGTFMETCQRLMLPYHDQGSEDQNAMDVKPNPKLLSLEWQNQACSDNEKDDAFGNYAKNLGSSWTGMANSYGPSTNINPLV